MGRLNESPGLELFKALGEAFMGLKRCARRHLQNAGYDLTFEQVTVLKILTDDDGLHPKEIADRTDREKTTVSRMIDGLERKNLVVRIPDRSDRRKRSVYLTHQGRQRVAEVEKLASTLLDQAYCDIAPERQWTLMEWLRQVTANLNRDLDTPQEGCCGPK
ncbi:MAG TPA: MarR family transcriptional regulator [Acidobacteriota bacterium]|nr:MarR family transcriptional regulator [Acidobacteriota bacterium]